MNPRTGRRFAFLPGICFVLLLLAPRLDALTRYHLRVGASDADTLQLVFALTCSDSLNALMILDASHDGSGRVAGFAGGPWVGDLIDGLNPAPSTQIFGGAFYNDIALLLEGLTRFDCDLEPTEEPPPAERPTSEVALCGLDGIGTVIASMDPLGANALAALDITGVPGGELSVFYPRAFIAPDTLFLDLDAPRVRAETSPPRERLRLSAVAPNPAAGDVIVTFDLPTAGAVRVRVFDVQGRLVAEPLNGRRGAGRNSVAWDMRGPHGRRLAAGLYVVEIRYRGQSVVRKFIALR